MSSGEKIISQNVDETLLPGSEILGAVISDLQEARASRGVNNEHYDIPGLTDVIVDIAEANFARTGDPRELFRGVLADVRRPRSW